MIAYILGERGSDSPVKVTTIQIYTDMFSLGRELIGRWAAATAHRNVTLEDFIVTNNRWSGISLYYNEINTAQKPKKAKMQNIWEAMQREEGLKKEITKAMLKA